MDEVRRTCLAWSIERLRCATDETYILRQYTVVRLNCPVAFSCTTIVDVLRSLHPYVVTYSKDHLMALRRCVEYDGTVMSPGRVARNVPFDPKQHVVHMAGASHLDHLRTKDLHGATIRGRKGGVLVWWG